MIALRPEDRYPKYWLVVDHLTKMIETEGLVAGDPLPTELELQNRFRVSRGTVRKAFDELSRRSLIERRPGSGTFVAPQRMPRELPELTGFSEHIRSLGLAPGSVELSRETLDRENGYAADFPPDTPLTKLTRLRTANDRPVGLHYLVVPTALVERVHASDPHDRSTFYDRLKHAGVRVDVAQEHLMARRPTRAEARHLGIGAGDAVLDVRRKTFDSNGSVVELVHAVYRGDRYDYVIWLERRRG